jgi:signal transduction histidine kinase
MRLIRVLMHEIMNSITPITSLSESLAEIFSSEGKPVTPDRITEKTISTTLNGLNVIREQGKGLKSFVDSYRRLTRLPEPEKKTFRIVDLFNRVQLLYESLENSSRIKLTTSLQDPEFEIFADQNLISQVLVNLVKNALEANEENPGGNIMISASEGSGNTWICVADNGPGIPPDIIDEIFVPFFTTRKNGSGIGLSVSRQIMKAHGGNLTVNSVPGQETVFCLSF